MSSQGAELRAAGRSLRSRPGLTTAIVLTLALGIGAVTALFSVVQAVLLRQPPFGRPDQLVLVYQQDRITGTSREPASVPDYYDLAARARGFASLAAFASGPVSLAPDGGEPVRLTAARVSHGFFSTLALVPILGRGMLSEEDRPGGPGAAVLGERLWRTRFAGEPAVLGRTIRIDDGLHTIVGVVPAGADLPPAEPDLYLPLQLGPASTPRSLHNVLVVGRLADGARFEETAAQAARIGRQLEAEYPATNRGRGFAAEPLREVMVGAIRPSLLVLLGAVTLVLLVACVNVANLLLAQAWARSREVAVRRALGATSARLARQFLAESVLLALAGGGLGVLLAAWGLDLLLRLAPADLPGLGHVRLDAGVLAVAAAVTLSVAVIFGLVPALQARRLDLQHALHGGARGATGGADGRRLRDLLVGGEVALSVMLVVGAGLLLRSLLKLQAVDPGFRTENVVKLDLTLPPSRYPQSFDRHPNWTEVSEFYRRLLTVAEETPGVTAVALAASHPLAPGFTNSFVIVGREGEYAQQPEISLRVVTPGYFGLLGVPLRRGRLLEPRDGVESPAVLLINEAAARRFFPGQDPVGQRLAFWGRERTIVGVVGNERFHGLDQEAPPAAYPPLAQVPVGAASLLVRAAAGSVPALQQAVWSLDPELALSGIEGLDRTLAESIARPRFTTALLGAFAAVALVLASVGVHGVLSFAVVQRTREIGIRLALGASRAAVLGMVVGRGLRLTLVGAAAGLAGALAVSRLLESLLFGVGTRDPASFAAAPVLLIAVAIVASWIPARRATRVDAMITLRSE
jgi:predicted permease